MNVSPQLAHPTQRRTVWSLKLTAATVIKLNLPRPPLTGDPQAGASLACSIRSASARNETPV